MIKQPKPTHHFFVCNVYEWRVGIDLPTLIKEFEKAKATYWIWHVPGTTDSNYEINFYQPKMKGAILLQEVVYEKRKRVNPEGVEA